MDREPLAANEVHVWRAPLDGLDRHWPRLQSFLSAAEQARARRLVRERDRRSFTLARGILRSLLARYVGIPAGEIVFHYPTSARPELPGSSLQFNLSHTEGMAVYALTLDRRVGIDVERLRPVLDGDSIARRNFAAEELEAYEALAAAARLGGFFRIWTRKEAYIKALGEGLGHDLTAFAVALDPPVRLLRTRAGDAAAWSLYDLTEEPAWIAALAVQGVGLQVRCRAYDPDES